MDFLFFFYLFVYVYLFQFIFFGEEGSFSSLWVWAKKVIVGLLGDSFKFPLTYMVMGFYFFFMCFICYTGHFSWNLAFGRMVDFVFVWAVVGWGMGVLLCLSMEIFSNVLGLFGEGYLSVLYAVWGKVVSIAVRPFSLMLRLLINLNIGHFLMSQWLFFSLFDKPFFLAQLVLMLIVLYELVVFLLQSFIFSRLLSVYLEEG